MSENVVAHTQFGPVRGHRVENGVAVWLEVPYALPPRRFQDPQPLPPDYLYEDKEFITENCAQPPNDILTSGMNKLGPGEPTEDCLFLNIYSPSTSPTLSGLPVKVYIHGGFLQFGSPHGLACRANSISVRNNEVWVNIAYRLSVFGFLACDKPRIPGNFGFKDQWMALEWVKDNIAAFGGNPRDIQVCGGSAGAHCVHQLLHHTSHLPKGVNPPFNSAFLQSNSIVCAPKTLTQLRPQFSALCKALNLNWSSPDILETLSDPTKVSTEALTNAIKFGKLGKYETFRSSADGTFLPLAQDSMKWQRGGDFGQKLKEKGIKSIVIGEVSEEWFLYSFTHPIEGFVDVRTNLERYYPDDLTDSLLRYYGEMPEEKDDRQRAAKLFGRALSDGQVHLPVRLLHRDLAKAGVPVLRYEIRWSPELLRAQMNGYVTHGSDRLIWAYLESHLEPDECEVVGNWLGIFAKELKNLEEGKSARGEMDVLTLNDDKSVAWVKDRRWNEMMNHLRLVIPGEADADAISNRL